MDKSMLREMGFDGLCRWVEWDKVALGVFFSIRVGFDGLCDPKYLGLSTLTHLFLPFFPEV